MVDAPMRKSCIQCQAAFEVADADLAFYEKINVPEPTWCPPCREMRRMAWCNERILYNETMAMLWFPMTKKEALAKGWRWEDNLPQTTGQETLMELPDNIKDVPDGITDEVLACESCRKNYRIIPQELAFYRKHTYPLPHECFDCRRLRRMKQRTPRTFWKRSCTKCGKAIQTTYSPDRPEIVYCESCYLKSVY